MKRTALCSVPRKLILTVASLATFGMLSHGEIVPAKAAKAPRMLEDAVLTLHNNGNGEQRVIHIAKLADLGGTLFYLPCRELPPSSLEGKKDAELAAFSFQPLGEKINITYAYKDGGKSSTVFLRGNQEYHSCFEQGMGLPAVATITRREGDTYFGIINATEFDSDGTQRGTFNTFRLKLNHPEKADYSPWEEQTPNIVYLNEQTATQMQACAFTPKKNLSEEFVNWLVARRVEQSICKQTNAQEYRHLYADGVKNLTPNAKYPQRTPQEIVDSSVAFAEKFPTRAFQICEVGVKGNQIEISAIFIAKGREGEAAVSVSGGWRLCLYVNQQGKIEAVKEENLIGQNHPSLSKGMTPFLYKGEKIFKTL